MQLRIIILKLILTYIYQINLQKIYRTPNSLLENANDLPASLRKYTQLLETVNDKDFETHIVEAYDCFMSEKKASYITTFR